MSTHEVQVTPWVAPIVQVFVQDFDPEIVWGL
jgi:hypothetical protein